VREDYARKRKPPFYVQIIIDVSGRDAGEIPPGVKAYFCGFATSGEVDRAPKRDFGSKFGGSGGYLCHFICIKNLQGMAAFSNAYSDWRSLISHGLRDSHK